MKKINFCKFLIDELVKIYQRDYSINYTIENDLNPKLALCSWEVAELIYPSIMYLTDKDVTKYNIETSKLRYSINQAQSPFSLVAEGEPENQHLIIGFVKSICDQHLANEPVLTKLYLQVMKQIDSDITLVSTARKNNFYVDNNFGKF